MNNHLLTIQEAAEVLRITPRTLYRLMFRGEIPSLKVGNSRRIPAGALFDYITAQTQKEMSRINGGQ